MLLKEVDKLFTETVVSQLTVKSPDCVNCGSRLPKKIINFYLPLSFLVRFSSPSSSWPHRLFLNVPFDHTGSCARDVMLNSCVDVAARYIGIYGTKFRTLISKLDGWHLLPQTLSIGSSSRRLSKWLWKQYENVAFGSPPQIRNTGLYLNDTDSLLMLVSKLSVTLW